MCAASRKTDGCNCFVGSLVWKMDEDPENRLLNKSETILI